jgi:GLPGLI family protein
MKTILSILFTVIVTTSNAQTLEGVVTYEEKVNMHRRLKDESFKAMVPEFQKSLTVLFFKGNEMSYKLMPEPEEEPEEPNANGVTIKMKRPKNEFYRNYDAQLKIELRELAGQKFLIEDTLRRLPWKMGTETKSILGKECLKATFTSDDGKTNVVAWFTDALPIQGGPNAYGGLPGLILEASTNDGEVTFTAQKIDVRPLNSGELSVPKGGKKVTEADFNKKRDDFIKEMGGQGGVRIIRN